MRRRAFLSGVGTVALGAFALVAGCRTNPVPTMTYTSATKRGPTWAVTVTCSVKASGVTPGFLPTGKHPCHRIWRIEARSEGHADVVSNAPSNDAVNDCSEDFAARCAKMKVVVESRPDPAGTALMVSLPTGEGRPVYLTREHGPIIDECYRGPPELTALGSFEDHAKMLVRTENTSRSCTVPPWVAWRTLSWPAHREAIEIAFVAHMLDRQAIDGLLATGGEGAWRALLDAIRSPGVSHRPWEIELLASRSPGTGARIAAEALLAGCGSLPAEECDQHVAALAFLAGRLGAAAAAPALRARLAEEEPKRPHNDALAQSARALAALDPTRAVGPVVAALRRTGAPAFLPPDMRKAPGPEEYTLWYWTADALGAVLYGLPAASTREPLTALARDPTAPVHARRTAAAVLYDRDEPGAEDLVADVFGLQVFLTFQKLHGIKASPQGDGGHAP